MTRLIKLFLLTAILAIGVAATPALASPLSDAKAAGYLGERADGYVGVVSSSAPSSAQALAKKINLQRKEKYRSIAKRNKTSLGAVEAVVGEKLIKRAGRGEYVKGRNGRWQRK